MTQDAALFVARQLGINCELLPHSKIRVSDQFGRSAEIPITSTNKDEIKAAILRSAMKNGLKLTA